MVATVTREFANSPVRQGAGTQEARGYRCRVLPGIVPSGVVCTALDVTSSTAVDESDATDVTSTVISGSPTVTAGATAYIITTSLVSNLVAGHRYKIKVKFTSGLETITRYFRIEAEA